MLNWINAENYTMETFLFFDRWILSRLLSDPTWAPWPCEDGRDYKTEMARALSRYPHVVRFCRKKAPECSSFLDEIAEISVDGITDAEARHSETMILQFHECYVVYAYPAVMDQLNYIRNWDPQRLYDLVDLKDKVVLDIGAGTGRLSFAAAKAAKRVYSSEPCDTLREYMRDRIEREHIVNMKVLDGVVTNLPYEDNTFDVVMSGHVVGDFYDEEIAEMTRVTKNGGYIVCCDGSDGFDQASAHQELVATGFEFLVRENRTGEIVCGYRKQVNK